MKKLLKALLVLVMMISLTGCDKDKAAYKKYSGSWVLTDAQLDENEKADDAVAAALALVKLFGGEIVMELDEDGTGKFNVLGELEVFSWNAEEIAIEENTYTYSVKNDVLTMVLDEHNSVTFTKKTKDPASH